MVREVPQLATVWEPWLDGACILKRMDQDPERFLLVLRQTPYSRRGLLRKTDFVHGFVVDIKHLLFDSLPFVSSDVLSSFRSRSPRLPLPRLHSPAARPRWYGSIINNIKLSCITGSLPRFTDFRECAAACKMDTISARPHCQGLSGRKGSASRPALSTFCKIHL